MTWNRCITQIISNPYCRGIRIRNITRRMLTKKVIHDTTSHLEPDPSLISVYCNGELSAVQNSSKSMWDTKSAFVYPNVITQSDEEKLISILETKFRRRRYENGHWDSVILKYREVELFDEESDNLKAFLQPIRELIEIQHGPPKHCDVLANTSNDASLYFSGEWLPCHAIDLHKDGKLNAHVDSVRFSGHLVCGLSLMSESVMRLKPSMDSTADMEYGSTDKYNSLTSIGNEHIDLLLPTRSLYVLCGMSRYSYSHELLPSGSLFRNDLSIERDRRLSIIFRDSKK